MKRHRDLTKNPSLESAVAFPEGYLRYRHRFSSPIIAPKSLFRHMCRRKERSPDLCGRLMSSCPLHFQRDSEAMQVKRSRVPKAAPRREKGPTQYPDGPASRGTAGPAGRPLRASSHPPADITSPLPGRLVSLNTSACKPPCAATLSPRYSFISKPRHQSKCYHQT